MFGSDVLEVAVGVILVFILISLACAAIREGIEAWLKTRAVDLERGIRELLAAGEGDSLVKALYAHPLICGLFKGRYEPERRPPWFALRRASNLPSYIPASSFALALLDIAAKGPEAAGTGEQQPAPLTMESVRANMGRIDNAPVRRILLAAADTAQDDLPRAQAFLERWFNSAMDRVAGWYRRRTQTILFLVGLLLAAVLNVNPIAIAHDLYSHAATREALVARATRLVGDPTQRLTYEETLRELTALRLPIGRGAQWSGSLPPAAGNGLMGMAEPFASWWHTWAFPVLGWLLTALAAMLGAPFWFDVLNKVTIIRSTVKPHEKSPEEASEDRQPAGQRLVLDLGSAAVPARANGNAERKAEVEQAVAAVGQKAG